MSAITSSLNELIETLKNGELGFGEAGKDANDPNLKRVFSEYSAQRKGFASELQGFVSKQGAEPEDSGTLAGSVHRGWINLRATVASREDLAILEECERGEDSAVETYEEAISGGDLGQAEAVVAAQLTKIRAAHNRIRDLRNSLDATEK